MNFVTWSIRNPVPVIMMFIALVIGGIWAFPKLQIQDQPDISFPNVFVQVGYAGVPPSQMETEITRKVEDAVSTIVGIEHINSTVSTGSSNTVIQFEFGTDLQQAMDDVRDAVSRIRPDIPIDATEPYIGRATTAGNAIIAFGVSSENLSATELSWFVDLNVMREISAVPGVGQVNRIGGVTREVRVDLDPDRMAALGVTAGDVSSQLVRTQVELPGGETRIGSQEQSVRTLGTIASVQQLAALPISLNDGRNVRLDSIADVRDQAAEVRQLATLDGKPVIGFQVMRAWGEGALQVADRTREAVKTLQQKYPQIKVTEIYSEVESIRASYHDSMLMLIEGAILAIIVVWLFLRDMRATLISAAALPLAIIPTFWALHIFGFSLNTMSMLALSLVVGMLVDDAIVEVENNVRHLRMGKPPLQAATDAAIEIGLAVVATTFTLVRRVHPGGVHGRRSGPVLQALCIHRDHRGAVLVAGGANADAHDGVEVHARLSRGGRAGAVQDLVPRKSEVGSGASLENDGRGHVGDGRYHLPGLYPAHRPATCRGQWLRQPQCQPAAGLDAGRYPPGGGGAAPQACTPQGNHEGLGRHQCALCQRRPGPGGSQAAQAQPADVAAPVPGRDARHSRRAHFGQQWQFRQRRAADRAHGG